jgi:lysophospholipase L1-like esterase
MIKYKFPVLAATALLVFCAFVSAPPKIKVYIIGDSTASIKLKKHYPETGWGMPFANFFKDEVVVDNRAQNGRSTKSFLAENRWSSVMDSLKQGDYVLIQFGHNDEVPTKKNATTPSEFQQNLKKFITDTRSRKAIPILITPVARRSFDEAGKFVDTHAAYSLLVKAVATAEKVPLIDLNTKSIALLEKAGPDYSAYYFNHLQPGEHPNYPDGKIDNTHFNELGARAVAQIVLQEIRTLQPDLAKYIVRR